MTEEEYARHNAFAVEAKPSMNRRRIDHDYALRRIYLISMVIEGRRSLLGRLTGEAEPSGASASSGGSAFSGETGSSGVSASLGGSAFSGALEGVTARVELSPLGQCVKDEWFAVTAHHPEVTAVSLQIMPDHLHGILFVERPMQGHLSDVIRGFKTSTNWAYRRLVLGQKGEAEVAATAAAPPQHSQQAETAAVPSAAVPSAAGSVAAASSAVSSAAVSSAVSASSAVPSAAGSAAVGFAVSASSAVSSAAVSSAAVSSAVSASSAVPASAVPFSAAPASAAVGCAAAVPQRKGKRDRSHESREHGLLWAPNYNDHILSGQGELARWRQYLADNPRRLFLRRQYPDLFRVGFGLRIGPFTCSAVGNRFLLTYPKIRQVQCSTHFYEEDIQKAVSGYMAAARSGAVLVSPSISEGEKRTMRTAFDAGLPLILISANGLGSYSKPGGAFFDACAEGRLLILSPFEHLNRRVTLTRAMCMKMNELARLIAEAAAPPQHSQQEETEGN